MNLIGKYVRYITPVGGECTHPPRALGRHRGTCPYHITGTAKPNVVKFCTQVVYINSSNRMTYYPQGCGYGYVTVLKFCRLP